MWYVLDMCNLASSLTLHSTIDLNVFVPFMLYCAVFVQCFPLCCCDFSAEEQMHPLHRSSFATKSLFETAPSQRWRRHLDVQDEYGEWRPTATTTMPRFQPLGVWANLLSKRGRAMAKPRLEPFARFVCNKRIARCAHDWCIICCSEENDGTLIHPKQLFYIHACHFPLNHSLGRKSDLICIPAGDISTAFAEVFGWFLWRLSRR